MTNNDLHFMTGNDLHFTLGDNSDEASLVGGLRLAVTTVDDCYHGDAWADQGATDWCIYDPDEDDGPLLIGDRAWCELIATQWNQMADHYDYQRKLEARAHAVVHASTSPSRLVLPTAIADLAAALGVPT